MPACFQAAENSSQVHVAGKDSAGPWRRLGYQWRFTETLFNSRYWHSLEIPDLAKSCIESLCIQSMAIESKVCASDLCKRILTCRQTLHQPQHRKWVNDSGSLNDHTRLCLHHSHHHAHHKAGAMEDAPRRHVLHRRPLTQQGAPAGAPAPRHCKAQPASLPEKQAFSIQRK